MVDPLLEREYNARALVPDHQRFFLFWREASQRAREEVPGHLDLAYGPSPEERLDLFPAEPSRGLLVFFHGGYWRAFSKDEFSWIAPPLVRAGWSVAVVNYGLCPQVSLGELVEQCRRSVDWLVANFSHLGPMVLAGHSAGGHIVGMLWATDWSLRGPRVPGVVGGLSLSGLFDLEPLLRTSINGDLRLAPEEVPGLSPARLAPSLQAPLVAAVGGMESSEFKRQSRLLAEGWPGVLYLELENRHHFDILEELVNPLGALWRALPT